MNDRDYAQIALVFSFIMPFVGAALGLMMLYRIRKSGGEGKSIAIAAIIVAAVMTVLMSSLVAALYYFGVVTPIG
ncbi:hypothetical protein JXB11_00755 [Candidatus Woesearchaeota archaeon]|nr:hypothetical protein [Candidatus Woesearchaeota archaeon]